MTVPSFFNYQLSKYIVTLAVIFQLAACTTADNFNGSTTGGYATASAISLSWIAPSERDDGTSISMAEISGYRIYYGTTQGTYTEQIDVNDGNVDQATLDNLTSGTYYLVLTTVDIDGRESTYSDEVVRII